MRRTFFIICLVAIVGFGANCGGGGSDDVLEPPPVELPADGSFAWDTQPVMTAGRVGEWNNLALDAAGLPVIAHLGIATPYEIHIAEYRGAEWVDAVVGFSGRLSSVGLGFQNGSSILSYFDGTDLQFYANGTSTPVDTTGETGDWSSLTVAPNGTIMISYQRCFFDRDLCNDTTSEVRRDLRFAHSSDGVSWTTETVEAGDTTSNSGFYTTIKMVQGAPIISYYNRAASTIRVARHNGGAFGDPAAWTIIDVMNVQGGDSPPVMSISSAGIVGLGIYDPSSQDLYYAESSDAGLSWTQPELVDRLGDVGSMASIAFDGVGDPTIVYYDGTDRGEGEGLKIAWRKEGSWNTRSIIRGNRIGQFPSLRFSTDGKPLVAHFDGSDGDLLYSTYSGPTWPPELSP